MIHDYSSLVAVLCVLATAACQRSAPAPPPAPRERYAHPESFEVIVDSAEWPRVDGRFAPGYPPGARQRGENARVIVAAIVDSTGHLEFPSVTLLSPANPEFDQLVCKYLSTARFNWRTPRPRRALTLIPWDFTVEGAGPLPPAPDYRDLAEQLNAIPRQELVERLEDERHCS